MKTVPIALALLLLVVPPASALVGGPRVYPLGIDLHVPEYVEVGRSYALRGWAGFTVAEHGRVGHPDVDVRVRGQEFVHATRTNIEGYFTFPLRYDARGDDWVRGELTVLPDLSGGSWERVVAAERASAPAVVTVATGPYWDEAMVGWTRPVDDGGAPILGYRVSALGGATVEAASDARTTLIPYVLPGAPVEISVRALTPIGPGAATTALYAPIAPAPVDDLQLAVTNFEVCMFGGVGCVNVAPNTTYVDDRGHVSPDVRATIVARLVRAGEPVTDTPVHLTLQNYVVGGYGSAWTTDRRVTDGAGSATHTGRQAGTDTMASGECRTIVATATATYGEQTVTRTSTATVCAA